MVRDSPLLWNANSYSEIRADEENGEPLNDAQYKRNREVEALLNIKLETVPYGSKGDGTSTFRKYVMAGDNAFDAGFVFGSTVQNTLSEPELIVDLSTIDTLDLSASWWDQNAVESFTFNGGIKTVVGDLNLFSTFAPILYFYNKQIAEDFGINDLYSLVREGKWTYDRAFDYCRKVASDLNGDTKMDENDRFGMALQSGLVADMLNSGNVMFANKLGSSLELSLNSERTSRLVELCVPFLNDFYVNCSHNAFASQYSNVFRDMHIPLFANNQIFINFNQLLIVFELRAMETDFGTLPTPKYDEAQEKYQTAMSYYWTSFLCVPATNDRLDMTGHVLDALGYYSQKYVTPAFVDTIVVNKALRDEASEEMVEIVLDNRVYDVGKLYNWGDIVGMVNNLGVSNSTDFASKWASVEARAKEAMEKSIEMMNQ